MTVLYPLAIVVAVDCVHMIAHTYHCLPATLTMLVEIQTHVTTCEYRLNKLF